MISPTAKIYLIAAHTSIAGLLYGLDTGSIGSITQMTQFTDSVGALSSTTQGIYVACILLSASLSSFSSGYVADRISRKYGILTGSLIVFIGTLISACGRNFATLLCARLITGIGQGQAISVVTVYLCEIAPQAIRGSLACMLQLFVTIGIAAGYFIAYGTANLQSSWAWRVPFVIQACLAAVLVLRMSIMPFSPRWLVHRGRIDNAREVLQKLRGKGYSVEVELAGIQASTEQSEKERQASYSEMFKRRYLKRTVLGIFIMSFQQLTGIDAILYYAPIVFTQAGFSSQRASFLASGISGIINLVFTIPAQRYVDKWGRKFPLVLGGLGMVACFFGVGSLYSVYGGKSDGEVYLHSKGAQWAVIVLVYVFVANFAWSWAVVGKIYACEIIPTRLRAKACAVQLLSNWLVNFAVALTAPIFLRASPSGPYFLFGSTTLFTVVVCWFFMPETKGQSLEEIEILFEATRNSHDEKVESLPTSCC